MTEPGDKKRSGEVDLLRQLADEIGLHAWLGGAELRNPGLRQEETRKELDALVVLRDELRLQLHLGRLEAADEFQRLEGSWRKVKEVAARVADDAEEGVSDLLGQIRAGYRKLLGR